MQSIVPWKLFHVNMMTISNRASPAMYRTFIVTVTKTKILNENENVASLYFLSE